MLIRFNSLLLLVLFSTLGYSKSFKIKGEVENSVKETTLYLYQHLGSKAYLFDSLSIHKNSFSKSFEPSNTPNGIYRIGFSKDNSIDILLEGIDLELTIDASNLSKKSNILRSAGNTDLKKYNEFNSYFDTSLKKLETRYSKIIKLQQTNPEAFKQAFEPIRLDFVALNTERDNFYRTLKSSTTSAYIKNMMNVLVLPENASKLNFFKTDDFTNESLAYSDVIELKIKMYFLRFGQLSQANVAQEMNSVLSLSKDNTKIQDVVYASLISVSAAVDMNTASSLSKEQLKKYPESPLAQEIKGLLPQPAPAIGDKAPEISLPNPEGEVITLSSLKGKIILLDFWASWCGPCRRESPNVVRAYHKYKEKGFTVYSVSLDGDKNRWVGAIKQDGLIWPNHVSDLKKWANVAARRYQVSGIPATYLIDENGIIIEKNLRGEALQTRLDQLFENK